MCRLVLCLALLAALPLQAGSRLLSERDARGGWTPEQIEVMAQLEEVGVALYRHWLVRFDACDIVPLPPWRGTIDVDDFDQLTPEEVAQFLEPDFIESVPVLDPWGTPIDYRFNSKPREALPVWLVRSAGSDQMWEGDFYEKGPTLPAEDERDIIWVHDTFEVWPSTQ